MFVSYCFYCSRHAVLWSEDYSILWLILLRPRKKKYIYIFLHNHKIEKNMIYIYKSEKKRTREIEWQVCVLFPRFSSYINNIRCICIRVCDIENKSFIDKRRKKKSFFHFIMSQSNRLAKRNLDGTIIDSSTKYLAYTICRPQEQLSSMASFHILTQFTFVFD